jgi:hypothetical protein
MIRLSIRDLLAFRERLNACAPGSPGALQEACATLGTLIRSPLPQRNQNCARLVEHHLTSKEIVGELTRSGVGGWRSS